MPVRVRPSLRINIAHTVMTAELLKPEIASFGVTTCVTVSAHRTSSATRSMRSTSLTNKTSATARMLRTMAISRVTARRFVLVGSSGAGRQAILHWFHSGRYQARRAAGHCASPQPPPPGVSMTRMSPAAMANSSTGP